MTRFGHKLNYVINTFVKRTPGSFYIGIGVPILTSEWKHV